MIPALSVEARWCWISRTSQFHRRIRPGDSHASSPPRSALTRGATRARGEGPDPVPRHHRTQKGPILTSPPSWTWSRSWRYHEPGRLARPCRNPGARSSQAPRPLSKASLGAVPAADHQPQSCSPARHQLCSNKPSTAPTKRNRSTTSQPPAEALLSSSVAVISASPSTRAHTNQ